MSLEKLMTQKKFLKVSQNVYGFVEKSLFKFLIFASFNLILSLKLLFYLYDLKIDYKL